MTPLQLAKQFCSSYDDSTNTCAGLTIADDGTTIRFRKAGLPCLLGEPVQRCLHAEQCVMPHDPSDWKDKNKAQSFAEAVMDYKLKAGVLAQKPSSIENSRPCPNCKVRFLEVGKHLCYVCADSARKASQRERNRRRTEKNGLNYTQS